MFTRSHQGVVKKTVVLEFENNYQIKLEAGVEMCMHLVMDEAQIKAAEQSVHPTGLTPRQKEEVLQIVKSVINTGIANPLSQ